MRLDLRNSILRRTIFWAFLAACLVVGYGTVVHAQTVAAQNSPSVADNAKAAASAEEQKVPAKDSGGFFSRFGKAYWEDWTVTPPDSPEPPRRGFPAPV